MQTLNKKAIWLFGGGDMQEISASKIKEMGFDLILTDFNPNCFCRKYADEFVALSINDIDGNLDKAKGLKDKYNIKAVFTAASDLGVEAVANVARYLGLPGVDPKAANIARNKFKSRELFSKAGILQPRFGKVLGFKEMKEAAWEIGFPVAVKATDSAGSRGFSKIEKEEDLKEDVFEKALENSTTEYVLVEELLIPLQNEIAEQSVETLWHGGKIHWLNWVDRIFRKDFLFFNSLKDKNIYSNIAWGVEIGHINPALHSDEITSKVKNTVEQAGKALGLHRYKHGCILKADIMLTSKGPFILEPALRLSGGWDSSLSSVRRGAIFAEGAIRMALGEEPQMRYFSYKKPELFCSVLSAVPENAENCLGRKFAEGFDFDREKSLEKAYNNLINKKFINN